MKECLLTSKYLTPEEAKKMEDNIHKAAQEYLKPFEGETKKSPEECKIIKEINSYLNQEFKALGLEKKSCISPKQLHLLSEPVFRKYFPDAYYDAVPDSITKTVSIDVSKRHKLQLGKSLIHEMMHLNSFQKLHFNVKTMETRLIRDGYKVINPHEEHHKHFRGLNEAVIDKMSHEIFQKHKSEIIKILNITAHGQKKPIKSFYEEQGYINVLDVIIEKIAEKNNEDKNTVWQRLKRGQFTGEVKHLQEVDKIFGKGSLRVLAALGAEIKNLPEKEVINKKILQYFETDDQKQKDKLAWEVLDEREWLRYKKLKNK